MFLSVTFSFDSIDFKTSSILSVDPLLIGKMFGSILKPSLLFFVNFESFHINLKTYFLK